MEKRKEKDMEKIKLVDGKEYVIAVNGFYSTDSEVKLKLVTEDTIETVCQAFSKENTQTMEISSDSYKTSVEGFTRRGNVITKDENAVIECKVIPEELDSEGNLLVRAGLEEIRGTTVSFSMYKDKIADKVEQNRADIDYLMMMEDEEVTLA